MLTAKQVASMLGLSQTKIYDLARCGKLRSYRFDGAVRFEPADVEAFKEACRVPPPPEVRLKAKVGTVWLRAASPESELDAYFRRAGLKPRRMRVVKS